MLEPEAASNACRLLCPADFTYEYNALIFKAMQRLYGMGKEIDLVTVTDAAYELKIMDTVGGIPYLTELSRYVPSTVNHMSYVRIMQEKSARRKVDKVREGLTAAVQDESRDITEIREKAISRLTSITLGDEDKEDTSSGAVILATVEDLERRSKYNGANQTGIADIDNAMGGLHPGELTLLAARPSAGKSALGWQIADHFAMRGQRVMFVSCEMTHEQLGIRWAAMHSRANMEHMRLGKMTDADWEEVAAAMPIIERLPMDTHTQLRKPMDIKKAIEERMRAGGLGIVVVDYLQLLEPDMSVRGNRVAEVSQISRTLKLMTTEFNIPILALSQLSRAPEGRSNKMPVLSDLRDSGALEQDANNVIFLMAPRGPEDVPGADKADYEAVKARGDSLTYCSIAKQRNGPLAEFRLLFEPRKMRMRSLIYDIIPQEYRQEATV